MAKMNMKMKETIVNTFEQAKTYEEIKKAYVGYITDFKGNASAVKFIQQAFTANVDAVKNIHTNKDGEVYEKEPKESIKDFVTLIDTLIGMDGVTVEVCGTWLWISGNTKDNKDALKACGFRYAAKKKMWYKAPEGTKHYKGKKSWDMKQIRDVYGSKVVEDAEEIAE